MIIEFFRCDWQQFLKKILIIKILREFVLDNFEQSKGERHFFLDGNITSSFFEFFFRFDKERCKNYGRLSVIVSMLFFLRLASIEYTFFVSFISLFNTFFYFSVCLRRYKLKSLQTMEFFLKNLSFELKSHSFFLTTITVLALDDACDSYFVSIRRIFFSFPFSNSSQN